MQNKRIGLKRKNKIRRMLLTAAVFLFLFISLVLASHHPKMIIADISIDGNSAITDRELASVINKELTGKYFRLFPKNHIFLYSKDKIKYRVLDTFKRVYFVEVSMLNLKSISVKVKERTPYVLWCEDINAEQEIANPSECYFLDDKGLVFTKAPIFSDDVYFIVFGSLLSTEKGGSATSTNNLGRIFLGEHRFTKLMQLREVFEKEGLEIARLRSIDDNDFEFYLSSGGKLIFSENQDMGKLFNNLTLAIEAKIDKGELAVNNISISEFLENIDYVDLRFKNKVLFKFLDKI